MLSFLFWVDGEGLLNRCEMFKNERVLFDVMTCSPPCLSDCIKTFTFGMTIGMSKDDSWIFDTLMIAKKKNLLLFHSYRGKRTINDYKNNRQPLSCTWVCCNLHFSRWSLELLFPPIICPFINLEFGPPAITPTKISGLVTTFFFSCPFLRTFFWKHIQFFHWLFSFFESFRRRFIAGPICVAARKYSKLGWP